MAPNPLRYAAIACFAWTVLPAFAVGADNEAGVPLTPAEAAGAWTLVAAGQQPVCTVRLGTRPGRSGYVAVAAASCGEALPAGVAGWTPTGDGMALTGADGRVLIAFDRWSN